MPIRPEDDVCSLGSSPCWLGSTDSYDGEGHMNRFSISHNQDNTSDQIRSHEAMQQSEIERLLTDNSRQIYTIYALILV